ncbi:cytochrome P450 family 72 subfamily A polypeptide 8 [Zea mays]|uniref:Cytochrome P450 family 72 subfamily A polypeptide 8 n=1 Tax=Zea mays TaxID=4577 RepID=A0A1D6NI54_MAIZE|nr:cytochrome P450 family 72 subfamily A polypeptide 8 [Zea mays]
MDDDVVVAAAAAAAAAAASSSPSPPWSLLQGLLALLVAWGAYRAAQTFWLRPRRLGRALRAQGLTGTAYRFPAGDLKENARLNDEARSRPMQPPCSHDVVPRVMPHLFNTVKDHGNICITWFGPIPRVVITEAELVRDILSNKFGHFEKFTNKSLGKMIALGVASYDGEKWAKHRRILNPAFHLEKLKRMQPAFLTCCTELIDRWDKEVAGGSDGSFELDVWPEFQSLTGDVISRTAFGSSFMEGRRIFQLQAEQAERVIKAFQYIYIPGFVFFPTPNNRRMKEINREIEGTLRGMIEKRERAIENGEASGDDLLGLLLQSNMESGKGGLRMSTEDVVEECKLFYFAGMETTSVLLTWTLVILGMHPEWQDRAREEVTMILYEVLRLYPPAVTLNRRTFKDMQIGGITYPAGVILELPVIVVHHDPDVWGKDAHEFRPERFAEGISKATKDQQPAFFPFGWGPRICIGQNFALLEAKMALSMILQRFQFRLSPSYTHAPYTVLLLHPQHGAPIIFDRI